jgi:hypothetical protein
MARKNATKNAAVLLGRRGGMATARNLTAEQRKVNARKAAEARWRKEFDARAAARRRGDY